MKKFFSDFKKFISRGNVIDLAVAVIVGNAFGKIVTSLVNDILMPLVTWGVGKASLAELSVPLRWETVVDPVTLESVQNVTLSWNYGAFLQSIIDFIIIAFCIFSILKLLLKSQDLMKSAAKSIEKTLPSRKEKKILKERGINLKDKEAVKEGLAQLDKEEEERKKAEEAAKPKVETEADILKEIRELMKLQLAASGSIKDEPKEE